jgi:hypothetical protein
MVDSDRGASPLTRVLADEASAIARELWARLEDELSDKDALAISTALTKAVIEGANRAIVDVTAQVTEQLAPQITMDPMAEVPDMWAEEYGPGE